LSADITANHKTASQSISSIIEPIGPENQENKLSSSLSLYVHNTFFEVNFVHKTLKESPSKVAIWLLHTEVFVLNHSEAT
jgi:hypothetical protein